MTVLYFTATGNSLYVAKQLGTKLLSIPHCIKTNMYTIEDDAVGIIAPVYGFALPKLVLNFLDKVHIEAKYKFLIGTYGSWASNFLKHTKNKYSSIRFNYLNQVKMVDNFVIGYDSQKQIKNAYKKHIDDAINMVKQDINARKTKTKFHFKLSAPFAFLIRSIAKNCGIRGIYVDANKCTKCGICTKVCPSGNITLQNQPTFANNCTNCLACVHHCPQKAVHCKGEKNTNRFINEHVTVQEIIKANSE